MQGFAAALGTYLVPTVYGEHLGSLQRPVLGEARGPGQVSMAPGGGGTNEKLARETQRKTGGPFGGHHCSMRILRGFEKAIVNIQFCL